MLASNVCQYLSYMAPLCYSTGKPFPLKSMARTVCLPLIQPADIRHRKHTYEQSTEHIAVPESAADVKRLLAETMAEVKAGKMDPRVANTVAYVATVLLRAYEADEVSAADTPAQPYVPLIYRSLMYRDGRRHEPDDVIDLETGERVVLPAPEVPCALQISGEPTGGASEVTRREGFSTPGLVAIDKDASTQPQMPMGRAGP